MLAILAIPSGHTPPAREGFDTTLARAAAGLGATPVQVFRIVILPIILPGVLSGAVFAFATSFDEIVLGLFLAGPTQRTIPTQMFNGVREEISPTITAAATLLALMSVLLLFLPTVAQLSRVAYTYIQSCTSCARAEPRSRWGDEV